MHHLQQVLLLSVIVLLVLVIISPASTDTAIAKPGCQDRCGNISVPYPFGIGSKDCYFGKDFEVTCNQTTNPPVLYYAYNRSPSPILQLKLDYVRMIDWASKNCYNKSIGENRLSLTFKYLGNGPFTYSTTRNKFTTIGCDIFGYIPSSDLAREKKYITGCASFCNDATLEKHSKISSCLGNNGCCQTRIPKGLQRFASRRNSINTDERLWEIHPCSYGFMVENDYYVGFDKMLRTTDDPADDKLLKGTDEVPVILDWALGNKTCKEAQRNMYSSSYACGFHSSCVDSENGPGYKCICSPGYRGNPYLPYGCQDIDECKEPNGSICPRDTRCINKPGDYNCVCPHGYHHEYGTKGSCKHIETKLPMGVVIPIGFGLGIVFVLLLVLSFWLYHRLQERKQIMKLKQEYFRRNGGLLMKHKICSHDEDVEIAKIFDIKELEKATDNFNQNRILGKGGFGTVYKGILSDGRIVAIKKSKLENESQTDDQFINEVVILSQINHRHIVRLLGCCLETQVPLLVYEFVSSGTLSQHLQSEGYVSSISWKDRLRIGYEIAGALAYLHSDASVPIFHRDIKSSNILLDECNRAKVCDFGLSRSVPIDKTHLTTVTTTNIKNNDNFNPSLMLIYDGF